MTGSEIKKDRIRLALTQAELGDRLGVSGNTVARWERDESTPESPKMLRLALDALKAQKPNSALKAISEVQANLAETEKIISRIRSRGR